MTHRHTQERHVRTRRRSLCLPCYSFPCLRYPGWDASPPRIPIITQILTFLGAGIPINLHFSLLPGGGSNNNLCIYIICKVKVKSPVHKPISEITILIYYMFGGFYSPASLWIISIWVPLHLPGVYTGHTEENFGPEGLERGNEFRTLASRSLKLEGGCHEQENLSHGNLRYPPPQRTPPQEIRP